MAARSVHDRRILSVNQRPALTKQAKHLDKLNEPTPAPAT